MEIIIVIVCVDDNNGLFFNNRRQSQDRNVRKYIANNIGAKILWMNPYSAQQFSKDNYSNHIHVSENCLSEAPNDAICFIENDALLPYLNKIDKIVLVKWNRVYPADTYLDIAEVINSWHLSSVNEFKGYSHDKITIEVYEK